VNAPRIGEAPGFVADRRTCGARLAAARHGSIFHCGCRLRIDQVWRIGPKEVEADGPSVLAERAPGRAECRIAEAGAVETRYSPVCTVPFAKGARDILHGAVYTQIVRDAVGESLPDHVRV